MNGTEATRAIRTLGYKGLVIGVTGNALGVDIQEFLDCGADHVMVKPFDLATFKKHVAATGRIKEPESDEGADYQI